MSSDAKTSPVIVIPDAKPRRGVPTVLVALIVVAVASLLAWRAGYRPSQLWASTGPVLKTLEVDQGDLAVLVVENGTLESSNNATARCQVEALIGTVGGMPGAPGARPGPPR